MKPKVKRGWPFPYSQHRHDGDDRMVKFLTLGQRPALSMMLLLVAATVVGACSSTLSAIFQR